MRKLFMTLIMSLSVLVFFSSTANAAPLPKGTVLKITPGNAPYPSPNLPCTSGSCIGWEATPGLYLWFNILPGTDGGFVVGKSQASGGQEIGISGTNATPGELTAAGPMYSNNGLATLYTMPDGGSVNLFDDASCTNAACLGKVELKTLNMADYGRVITLAGSSAACNTTLTNCTADQKAGIFVNNYTIDLVGNTWTMDYTSVVPGGQVENFPLHVIFRGTVVRPNCPVVGYVWTSPTDRNMLVFGSKLQGATGVMINGVNAPIFQYVGDDILWVLPPASVTWPWKPGTVQVTNANAGCSGNYPNSCTP